MRERAAKTAEPKQQKQHRVKRVAGKVFSPARKLGGLKIWKPFKFIGRFLAKYVIPPYIRNSFRELRQVTWPSRKQTLQLTRDVILFSVIFGILVAIFDFGLDKLFKQVILR